MDQFMPLIYVVILLALVVVGLLVVRRFFPELYRRLWSAGSERFPQDLNPRIAERITEAHRRVSEAKATLEALRTTLRQAEQAAAANAEDAALRQSAQRAQQQVDEAQAVVAFEESQLDQLLHPGQTNWGVVLQYAIFASLALFVLWRVMEGITNSLPPGMTPRIMITVLVAVATVGIAMILVLATIVSSSNDRKERFAQGKEVLTLLLGILGTIVGFYFGTAQNQASEYFTFDPLVISQSPGKPTTLSTSVHGGKAPYSFGITFTPASISAVPGQTNGPIKAEIPWDAAPDQDVSIQIRIVDSEGKAGEIKYDRAVHLPAAEPAPKKNGSLDTAGAPKGG